MALPICHLIMLEGDGGYAPFVDVCVPIHPTHRLNTIKDL
jgi:hypothetical protein